MVRLSNLLTGPSKLLWCHLKFQPKGWTSGSDDVSHRAESRNVCGFFTLCTNTCSSFYINVTSSCTKEGLLRFSCRNLASSFFFSQAPYEKAFSSSLGVCLTISFPSVLNRCKMPLKIRRGRWRSNLNEATASRAGIRVDDAVASVLSLLCGICTQKTTKTASADSWLTLPTV